MAAPAGVIHFDGFEYNLASILQFGGSGQGLVDARSGTPNPSATRARTGTYSLQLKPNGTTAAEWTRNLLTSDKTPRTLTVSVYILFTTLPTATDRIFRLTGHTTTLPYEISFNNSSGKLRHRLMNTGAQTDFGPALSMNTWYCLQFKVDMSTTTFTATAQVDGANGASAVNQAGTAQDIDSWALGSSVSTANYTMYADDLVVSNNNADYGMIGHSVEAMVPTADGTNNPGTVIKDHNGNVIDGAHPAWSLMDEWPPNTTDFVEQDSGGTNRYAEVTFGGVSANVGKVWAVSAIAALISASTAVNDGTTRIVDSGGTTLVDVYAGDMSETSLNYRIALVPAPGSGWGNDASIVNAILGRVGFSGDANPIPEWSALMVQVLGTPAVSPPQIASGVTVFSPAIGQSVAMGQIIETVSVFNPSIGQKVVPTLITETLSVFNPTVTPGPVSVVAPLIASAVSVFSPTVKQTVAPPLISNVGQVFAPVVTSAQTAVLPLIASGVTLFQPTVTAVSTVQVPAIASAVSVFAPVISSSGFGLPTPVLVGDGATQNPGGTFDTDSMLFVDDKLYAVVVFTGGTVGRGASAATGGGLDWASGGGPFEVDNGNIEVDVFFGKTSSGASTDVVEVTVDVLTQIVAWFVIRLDNVGDAIMTQAPVTDTGTGTTPTLGLNTFGSNLALAFFGCMSAAVFTEGAGFTYLDQKDTTVKGFGAGSLFGEFNNLATVVTADATLDAGEDWIGIAFELLSLDTAQQVFMEKITETINVFNPTVSPGAVNVPSPLIASAVQVFSPAVLQSVAVPLITESLSVFNPQVTQQVVAQLIGSNVSVFTPAITQSVSMQLIASVASVFNPTVTPGGVSVLAQLISSAVQVFSPSVAQQVVAQLISETLNIFNPAVTQTVAMQLIASSTAVFTPAITQRVSVPVITETVSVFNPSVTVGGVNVEAPLIASATQVFTPDVTIEAQPKPPLIASATQVFAPTTIQQVDAPTIPSGTAVFSPAVSPRVAAQLIASGVVVFNPSVREDIAVPQITASTLVFSPQVSPGGVSVLTPLIGSHTQVFSPDVSNIVAAPLISSGTSVFSPTVIPPPVLMQLIASNVSVFAPRVVPGDVNVVAPNIPSNVTVFSPSVVPGAVNVFSESIESNVVVFAPRISQQLSVKPPFIGTSTMVFTPEVINFGDIKILILNASYVDSIRALVASITEDKQYPASSLTDLTGYASNVAALAREASNVVILRKDASE